jgi:hypothetical protein
MRIIKWLEVVQIKEHQCAIANTARTGSHALAQAIIEQMPVRQPGQRVMERQ